MTPRQPVFDGLADLEAAEPALVAAHLLVEVFGPTLDKPKASEFWHSIGQQLTRLGGFEARVGFLGGDATVSAARDLIALECVLLWETATLAGRQHERVLLLRAGRAVLVSASPVDAAAAAIRGVSGR